MSYKKFTKLQSITISIIIGIFAVLLIIMAIKEKEMNDAEYELYELGVTYYNQESYESAYSVFSTICNANASMKEEKLNKRFPDISSLRENSYEGMILKNVCDYINYNTDYQKAIEEAVKLHDENKKDEVIGEILYMVGDDAIYEYQQSLKGVE